MKLLELVVSVLSFFSVRLFSVFLSLISSNLNLMSSFFRLLAKAIAILQNLFSFLIDLLSKHMNISHRRCHFVGNPVPVIVRDNNSQTDSHYKTRSVSQLSITAYRRFNKTVPLNSTLNAVFILFLKNSLVLINHSSAAKYVKYIFTLF